MELGILYLSKAITMKIKVTTERECCADDDLLPFKGKTPSPIPYADVRTPKFCRHCGQLWYYVKEMDAAGDMDWERTRY